MNYNVCYFFLYIYQWLPMREALTCFFTTSWPRGGKGVTYLHLIIYKPHVILYMQLTFLKMSFV